MASLADRLKIILSELEARYHEDQSHREPGLQEIESNYYRELVSVLNGEYRTDLYNLLGLEDPLSKIAKAKKYVDRDPYYFGTRRPTVADLMRKLDRSISKLKEEILRRTRRYPLQAFLYGCQKIQNEFEAIRLTMPKLRTIKESTVDFIEQFQYTSITKLTEDQRQQIHAVILEARIKDWDVNRISKEITERAGDFANHRAYLIARSEVTLADAQGRISWAHQHAKLRGEPMGYLRANSFKDCCSICGHLYNWLDDQGEIIVGRIFRTRDLIGKSNYGRSAEDMLRVIPSHPACRCSYRASSREAFEAQRDRIRSGEFVMRTYQEVKQLRQHYEDAHKRKSRTRKKYSWS